MANIFDRMSDVFSGEQADAYVAILNQMGSGNPFKNTKSIALINESPTAASGTTQSSSKPKLAEDKRRLLPVLIGAGILVVVMVNLFWVANEMRLTKKLKLDRGDGEGEVPVIKPADEETQRYLDTIRKHFDEDASKTDAEDMSLEGGSSGESDDDATQATGNNRQSLIELREAMQEIDSLSQANPELSLPAPPSESFDDEYLESDNASSVAPFDEPKAEKQDKEARKEAYMKYLDIVSSSSFDVDLRN